MPCKFQAHPSKFNATNMIPLQSLRHGWHPRRLDRRCGGCMGAFQGEVSQPRCNHSAQLSVCTSYAALGSGLNCSAHTSASHGVRTVENLRIHCGIEDPEEQEVRVIILLTVNGYSHSRTPLERSEALRGGNRHELDEEWPSRHHQAARGPRDHGGSENIRNPNCSIFF